MKQTSYNSSQYLPQPIQIERTLANGYQSSSQIFSDNFQPIQIEPINKPHARELKSIMKLEQANKQFSNMDITKESKSLTSNVQQQAKQIREIFDYNVDKNTLLKRRAKLFSPARFIK
ncbi:Hypothetical_protein [Hexamita inflata]|uniref:Hypothetical_protein n=1 Tax=Hexamita inflata TaxID=28002 RepID=A0AA86PIR4_9EUKA|nr:Hypothetical protein HINF_LOCUS24022 [Hexamita inflata]